LHLPLLAMLTGCGAEAPDPKAAAPPREIGVAAAPPQALPAKSDIKVAAATEPWGTVKGRIIWGGLEAPKRPAVEVKKDHIDYKFCMKDGEFFDETFIVDAKSKGLKNVFVWLAAAEKDGKLAIHPDRQKIAEADKRVVMDQPVCMFLPHALALREGQILVVKNTSKVTHNFKWGGHPDVNPGGNPSMPAGTEEIIANIKADRIPIQVQCGIHPWMKGWIRAFDHPYFAVTDEQGRFEIKDAPTGACRLVVWHAEGWLGGAKGKNGKAITIQSGDNDLGTLEFPPPN